MSEQLNITGPWVEGDYNQPYQYAPTSDPRVLALIKRDDTTSISELFDGDAINPIYYRDWRENGLSHVGGWDDEDVASAWSHAYTYRWSRDSSEFADRFVRIFYGATVAHVAGGYDRDGEYLVFDTPDYREHVGGGGEFAQEAVDEMAKEIVRALDGEVFGVGYALNEERTDFDEDIDLDDSAWSLNLECWGFVGERNARVEALDYTSPNLSEIGEPRMFRVTYAIDVEARSPQGAAEAAATVLSGEGAPWRGSYEVSRAGMTVTVDLGEGEF